MQVFKKLFQRAFRATLFYPWLPANESLLQVATKSPAEAGLFQFGLHSAEAQCASYIMPPLVRAVARSSFLNDGRRV